MRTIILALTIAASPVTQAVENTYKPDIQYGSTPLYYSHESIMQRNILEPLNKANDIANERLEIEKEYLRNKELDQEMNDNGYGTDE